LTMGKKTQFFAFFKFFKFIYLISKSPFAKIMFESNLLLRNFKKKKI
jgi:hypothetical protein